jgi:hypothetical protein
VSLFLAHFFPELSHADKDFYLVLAELCRSLFVSAVLLAPSNSTLTPELQHRRLAPVDARQLLPVQYDSARVSNSRPRCIWPFVHNAATHDENYPPHSCQILQWVAVERNEIRFESRC